MANAPVQEEVGEELVLLQAEWDVFASPADRAFLGTCAGDWTPLIRWLLTLPPEKVPRLPHGALDYVNIWFMFDLIAYADDGSTGR